MPQGNPLPGEKYLHFKNRLYQIITIAYHSENLERYVVYQALYGDYKTYVRPYDMFISEVDREKYPEVEATYRFTYQGTIIADTMRTEAHTEEKTETAPVVETTEAEEVIEEAEERINPWLEKFLDATSFDEKYRIICDMQREVTDRLIDDIAVVADLAIPEGDLSERYSQLKYCFRTKLRYESERFR